jgi:DNA-directed RNA polymerase specialized sigma24 family protein
VFDANFSAIASYVIRRLSQAEMEEVVSDVFATAWSKWTVRPPDDELRPWLFGIARRRMQRTNRTGSDSSRPPSIRTCVRTTPA